jgi:hypothetical protein
MLFGAFVFGVFLFSFRSLFDCWAQGNIMQFSLAWEVYSHRRSIHVPVQKLRSVQEAYLMISIK